MQPIDCPSLTLNPAIERRAFVTTGCWPVMTPSCQGAVSRARALVNASPRPILTTTFEKRGACMGLENLKSSIKVFLISLEYLSSSLGFCLLGIPVSLALAFGLMLGDFWRSGSTFFESAGFPLRLGVALIFPEAASATSLALSGIASVA